jgi:hypothetical protein
MMRAKGMVDYEEQTFEYEGETPWRCTVTCPKPWGEAFVIGQVVRDLRSRYTKLTGEEIE